ncbi:hypothetical protein PPYR_09703 [Photinus pyralis]|uniref:hydroxymethylbilane synthase n=1 Tax=Photinus pyralis TaxID=7054 RepID=A0A1Y1LL53_PHOPY|nr:porphobilinogen deaminase [Photinus pyralis]KAB0798710.1 hypothetical protein PPYR_09703 [Photinus pyralis]
MEQKEASTSSVIRVGSRKSELALIQTRHVISLLKNINPQKEFEIVTMSTLGDKVLDIPLPKIGEKSLFTRELETALITGAVDFVVHSLKDLPTTLPTGMAIGAVLTREDPRDALVLRSDHQHLTLETLPENSVIGTSSLRRTAQLAKKFPHLKVESIRGNLNTRLRKLDELGHFHAIILATAGLNRMGWKQRISKVIEEDELLYAVGQGALAVECRESDENTILLLKPLYDPKTAMQVIAERSFLRTLGGGCSAPVAVTTKLVPSETNKFKMSLTGAVWSLDGKEELIQSDESQIEIRECNRCAVCPFGFKSYDASNIGNISSCTADKCTNTDIECLQQCSFKRPTEETNGNIPKKQKSQNPPAELLNTDFHQYCPLKIPVGLDFMGKCPYLESEFNTVNIYPKRCPIFNKGQVEGMNGDFSKCPFLKEGLLQEVIPDNNNKEKEASASNNSNLYVGLVPHVDIPESSLKEAQQLGTRLAKNLMNQGATEIMSKAQEIIRNG